MTQHDRERSILDDWGDNPAAALAAAAVGALAGSAITALFIRQEPLTGDEAPIRVRNGSMEIELLHARQHFEEDGNSGKKKWKIKSGPMRGKDIYTVLALPKDLASCPNGLVLSGSDVEFTYSDQKTISFKAPGKQTRITSPGLKHESSAPGRLRYEPAGYIERVQVGSTVLYKHQGADPDLQIILLDI